ncbi:metal-dependent hydrolase [uncultured Methanomethylovorans sp.]|uniref:metal-dependent hydrolase n=1 Tax=uncultured Methanomethylovorans sp. TaxID=183759 RepID=UPI0026338A9B|nr:metal-dependent hydrolase [uncultured Methanomethylovorans sp.]
MPYPLGHLTFFVLLLFPVALYGFAKAFRQGKVQRSDWWYFLALLAIGSFFSLFPDISAVINLILYGARGDHCTIGSFPTHSLLFSSIAFVGGVIPGMMMYRQRNKALAVGVFAAAASLFHLILDDIDDGIITYLYPLYSEPFSLFPLLSGGPSEMGILYYGFMVIVGAFSIVLVLLMAFLSLRYLGFGFRYDPFRREIR